MQQSTHGLLFWTPRLLAVLFVVFVSMLALDVFQEGLGFRETIGALLMHLIPSALLLAALALAWKWEWLGAMVFSALGVLHVGLMWGRVTNMLVGTPLFLIAALFLAGWLRRGSPESAS